MSITGGVVARGQGLAGLQEAIETLLKQDVMVGIPEGPPREDGGMTNAQIGYVHENGSPANNTPERRFLVPGVEAVQAEIAKRFEKATQAALDGNTEGVMRHLNAAGMIAQNSVKAVLNAGDFTPLAQRTIYQRELRGITRISPLVDTAQMRNSITYVVRKKD